MPKYPHITLLLLLSLAACTDPSDCQVPSVAIIIGCSSGKWTTEEAVGWETRAHESFADMLKALKG
jgi:hypothetical protein